jgi:hypothetical protein
MTATLPRTRSMPVPDVAPRPPPECSTACHGDLDCPAIAGQSVPLSAVDPRSERRSDHGQMIFGTPAATREPGADLGLRGAPLRNRTVDLLLTICKFLGSLSGKCSRRPTASAYLAVAAACGICDRSRHRPGRGAATGAGPCLAVAVSAAPGLLLRPGSWRCMPASHVHADGQEGGSGGAAAWQHHWGLVMLERGTRVAVRCCVRLPTLRRDSICVTDWSPIYLPR